jgi:short-subunit dehydrogenase
MELNGSSGAVFISGGMSGIGKSLACEYINRKYDVAIFNRSLDPSVIDDLEGRALTAGVRVMFYQTDVTNSEEISNAMCEAAANLGSPKISINSAGIQDARSFLDMSSRDFESVILVNLIGARNFSYASVKLMKPGSQLILMSSMAGLLPNYTYSAYCASKFGVYGLAKVLKIELERLGIGVGVVCPPEVDTPMIIKERRTAHPVSLMMKSLSGSLRADDVSKYVAKKVSQGRFLIIPGVRAKLLYLFYRVIPVSFSFLIIKAVINHALRKYSC